MLAGDQPIFHGWRVKHPEILHLVRDFSAPSLEAQNAWFERSSEPDRRMFSILARENLELIGHGGLVDIDEKRKSGQLRTTIGNPAFWGKGYGTEATTLIVAYGFGDLALGNIWLLVAEDNVRAIRSYTKVGFREEGREEFQGEEFLRMGVMREEFLVRHAE